mgnify:CR=1 FL=1
MNVSEKSKKIIDSCRFCWMCRHICPIGNATGQERDTSRARALGLSMIIRGSVEPTNDIVDNLYECACCSACACECVTGWNPVTFTKEARLQAAMDGKTPIYIRKLIDNCLKTGNPYGEKEIVSALKRAADRHSAKTDTLLYLGSDARFRAPKSAVNAITSLEKAGVEFTVLADEPDSGAAMEFMVSETDETSQMMKKAVSAMNHFKTVIVYEPMDAKVILREYREWKLGLEAKIVLFPVYVAELLELGKLSVKKTEEKITCQDSYILARELEETESARKVISACGQLTEMLLNRKATVLAGHLLMAEYLPKVIDLAAERRMHEAKASGADVVVVETVADKVALEKVGGLKVQTFEELLLSHLN